MTDQNIKIAFDLFDTDGNGTIDINEFYHLISNCDGDKKVEHTKGFACVEHAHDHDHENDDHGLDGMHVAPSSTALAQSATLNADNASMQAMLIALEAKFERQEANFENQGLFLVQNNIESGETFNLNITGLIKETKYWFAVKSLDQFDNILPKGLVLS